MVAARTVPDRIARTAASAPGLRLLVLYGSRARGDARPDSDWDFGFGQLDLARVHAAARTGPDDLRPFVAAIARTAPPAS